MSKVDATRFETEDAWRAEAVRRFGTDGMKWKFVCPSCGHVASVQDWKDAGAPQSAVAFSCVGRWLPDPKRLGEKPGPCDYAGGGLFQLNPVSVGDREARYFAFADAV